MRMLVGFDAPDGSYAVPVEHAVEVRRADGIVALPAPAPGVVGVLARPGGSVTVVAPFGPGGREVLVVEAAGRRVGLLVDRVVGVVPVADAGLAPAPAGQAARLVGAVVHGAGGLTFVVDVQELVSTRIGMTEVVA